MSRHRLRAPDGLVHEGLVSSVTSFNHTACESRWGDTWRGEDLQETDEVTTCLRCLVMLTPAHWTPYVP